MIVVLKNGAEKQKVEELKAGLKAKGLEIHESKGRDVTILGLIGDTSRITPEELLANEIVESAQRVKAPYKQASRSFHPADTVISVKTELDSSLGAAIGDGKTCAVMAGPCSVENEEPVWR